MFTYWLILVLALIALMIWKLVVNPSVTVVTDKIEYGTTEDVTITGTVDVPGDDIGKTVSSVITPPSGDTYVLPGATTDSSGEYSIIWNVPSDAVEGIYTVLVQSVGSTASTTFTQI